MRIDLVFPRFKVLSGAERQLLGLASALVRAGHQPRVVCHQFDDSCRDSLDPGVELAVSGARLDFFRNRYLNAGVDYLRVLQLRRLLDPTADARVLTGPALWLLAWLRLVRRERLPLVYHCFEPPRVLYQDREAVLRRAGVARPLLRLVLAVYRRLDRRLARLAGAMTTAGPYSARRAADIYGMPAIGITNGLDRARLDAARRRPPPPKHDLVTVNYLHPRKRVDLIIGALAQLPARTLEVVGAGPERPRLEAEAARLGVAGRVDFAGFVSEDRLADHYCAARCYVHAARDESFGLSVIEAAYCGLPVVAVAEGGVVDNVEDGVTGRLTDADEAALAAALEDVLDSDERTAMGLRGRQLVDDRYRWERGADDLLGAIRSAV